MIHKVNQDTYARLFKHLLASPITAHELVEETGVHIVTAQSLMRCLKKHKVVHIFGWEKDTMGRDATPIYKLGRGKDRPRERLSAAERQRRYKAKKKGLALQNVLFGGLNHEHSHVSNNLVGRDSSGVDGRVGAGNPA